VCLLVNEFWFSNLSSGVGVGFIVWYRAGVSVGCVGSTVGGVPGAGWEIVF